VALNINAEIFSIAIAHAMGKDYNRRFGLGENLLEKEKFEYFF